MRTEVWVLIDEMEKIIMRDTEVSDGNLRWDLSKNLTATNPLTAELDVEETDLDTVIYNILTPIEDVNWEGKRDLLVNVYKLIDSKASSFSGDYDETCLQVIFSELTPWVDTAKDDEEEINTLFTKVQDIVASRL